jgi:hypothetical protein
MNGGCVVCKERWPLDVCESYRSLAGMECVAPAIKHPCILCCIVSSSVNNTSQDTPMHTLLYCV